MPSDFGDQTLLRGRAALVGVAATPQGVHPGRTEYQLGVQAFRAALDDCGLPKHAIDGVLTCRQMDGSGLDALTFARLVGLNPRVTAYLDYATGGFTVQYAAMLVATGACTAVACVFGRNPKGAGHALAAGYWFDRRYGLFNHQGVSALGWSRHMALYGSSPDSLGPVAVALRKHARLNPDAAFRDPLTLDDYLATPYLIWPFREHDVVRMTAGAAAVIVTTPERAADLAKPPVLVEAIGRQQSSRTLENEGHFLCHAMRGAAEQVYHASGLGPQDIDVLGVSDGCTAAVMHTLENYGFCGEGESVDFVADGGIEVGGRLPVNTDGGQLSAGYLVGWLHQVELVRQLRGECGPRQVADARIGMYTTTGRFREDYLATIYRRAA